MSSFGGLTFLSKVIYFSYNTASMEFLFLCLLLLPWLYWSKYITSLFEEDYNIPEDCNILAEAALREQLNHFLTNHWCIIPILFSNLPFCVVNSWKVCLKKKTLSKFGSLCGAFFESKVNKFCYFWRGNFPKDINYFFQDGKIFTSVLGLYSQIWTHSVH